MKINEALKESFTRLCEDVRIDVPMSEMTTFRIGGAADVVINITSTNELQTVINFIMANELPYTVIGNGSNLLVSDEGLHAVVIHIGKNLSSITVRGDKLEVECGATLAEVANRALSENLTGLEFAHGIPGTMGGGIYMNAGAYGGELKNVIESVTYLDIDRTLKTKKADELDFGYRHSYFSDKRCIIVSCVLKLSHGDYDTIQATMKDLALCRRDKQPLEYPSAGSTFKRPEGYFAGKLIQDANMQGVSVGGAEVSTKHAGFIINKGGATAKDVLELISKVQQEVKKKFNVDLEPEVRILGPEV